MTSCILTVIKDEQEYIEEFITYHLKLGVKHIFLFEDIGSTSHKDITDKYEDVTLQSVLDIFDEDMKQTVIDMKNNKERPQCVYILQAFKYIKENFEGEYDWCFVIDNDEFITLEKDDAKLDDVLELYKDYDAFVLQWVNYGANGHLKKPDYNGKGLVDTYTKPAGVHANTCSMWRTKTCYKIKTFKEEFLLNHHQPSNDCNWCRTNFLYQIRYKSCLDTIYIRHYITKSWEEYVWKVKKRGLIGVDTRNLNYFFFINDDLNEYKNKLIKEQI